MASRPGSAAASTAGAIVGAAVVGDRRAAARARSASATARWRPAAAAAAGSVGSSWSFSSGGSPGLSCRKPGVRGGPGPCRTHDVVPALLTSGQSTWFPRSRGSDGALEQHGYAHPDDEPVCLPRRHRSRCGRISASRCTMSTTAPSTTAPSTTAAVDHSASTTATATARPWSASTGSAGRWSTGRRWRRCSPARARVWSPRPGSASASPEPGTASTSVRANQRMLHRFLTEVVGHPAIVVGNSMGGMVSALQARRAPRDGRRRWCSSTRHCRSRGCVPSPTRS